MARLQFHRCGKREWFRLRNVVADAGGTECHGGGIILSKKPPEWHLSLPLPVAGFWCSLLPLPVAGFWCSLLPLPVAGFWCSLPPLSRGFTTGSHEGDAVKAFNVSTFLLFLRYNRRFGEYSRMN